MRGDKTYPWTGRLGITARAWLSSWFTSDITRSLPSSREAPEQIVQPSNAMGEAMSDPRGAYVHAPSRLTQFSSR